MNFTTSEAVLVIIRVDGWDHFFLSGHFSAFLPAGAAKRVKCVKIGLWQNKRDEKKMSIKRYCVQRQQKEPNHSCLRVWNSKTKIITNPIEKEIRTQFIQKLGIFEPTFCLIWLVKKYNLMLLNWCSINLNNQHVNGMTHFDLAPQSGTYSRVTWLVWQTPADLIRSIFNLFFTWVVLA